MDELRDVVYFLAEDLPMEGAELCYSLRSLVNLPHNKVWIVTPKAPEWIVNVNWLQWKKQKPTKYVDLSAKYRSLRNNIPGMTDKIWIMDDDIYVTGKQTKDIPIYYNSRLADAIEQRKENYKGTDWVRMAYENTLTIMEGQGWPRHQLLHPIQHTPYPLTRSEIPVHLDKGHLPCDYKTLNLNYRLHVLGEAPKKYLGAETKTKDMAFLKLAHTNFGILSTQEGLHHLVFDFLKELFPDKGQYEVH